MLKTRHILEGGSGPGPSVGGGMGPGPSVTGGSGPPVVPFSSSLSPGTLATMMEEEPCFCRTNYSNDRNTCISKGITNLK